MADGLFSSLYKTVVPVNARMALEHFTGTTAPITEKDFTPEELTALRQAIEATQKYNADAEAMYRANLKKSKTEYEKNPQYMWKPSPTEYSPNRQISAPMPYEEWLNIQKKAVESFEKTRDKTSFGYGSYDVKSGDMGAPIGQNLFDAIYQSYNDPAFRMASTIGSANFYNKKGQIPYVEDTYGFVAHPEIYRDTSKLSNMDVIRKFVGTPAAMLEILASRLAPQRRPVNIKLPVQDYNNPMYKDPFADTTR